jgi:endonuclease III
MKRDKSYWPGVFALMKTTLKGAGLPSVSMVAENSSDPFKILISTMISLRTKDEVTLEASNRLFKKAPSPEKIRLLPEEEIAALIYPAGFYRTKAGNIKKTCEILINSHRGLVPQTIEDLLALPGVGRKTANLVLSLGFRIDAICVDTHVHRISNRLGWVSSKTPEETEKALMEVLPIEFWIPVNELLVTYGQNICKPASPLCSRCPLSDDCPKEGVNRSR